MTYLFDRFPVIQNETIEIHRMDESDLDDLIEIAHDDQIYRYIPPFLYKKSKGNLLAAIRNLSGREFDKKRRIVVGIYHRADRKMIGLFEVFDFKKRRREVTIGYRVNVNYWHRGIATQSCQMMREYLSEMADVDRLTAYVMPENIYSSKVLLSNGFQKMPLTKEDHNWGQQEDVTLDIYQYQMTH